MINVKRYLTLLLAAMLLFSVLSAAGSAESETEAPSLPSEADEALMEELFAANSNREVLARHTSVEIRQEVYDQGAVVGKFSAYADAGTYFSSSSSGTSMLITGDTYLEQFSDGYDVYVESFLDGTSAYKTELASCKDGLSLIPADDEQLIRTEKNESALYVMSSTKNSDFISNLLSSNRDSYGAGTAYEEGMAMYWAYHFDAATKDLLEVVTFLQAANGSRSLYMLDSYTYDGKPFDPADSLFSDYFAAENTRTIYVVFDTGTRLQHTETYSIPEGVFFDIMLGGEWVTNFYSDPACTHVFDFSMTPLVDGITVYVKADWKTAL